jgi:hypothetical protein
MLKHLTMLVFFLGMRLFINMNEKVRQLIDKVGIFKTIKLMGGYNNFEKVFPDYFSDREHKVDLINGIVNHFEPDGYIYMYEINGMDIKIWEEEIEDGHTQEDYITFVGDETVGVSVYEYDEEGEMYDEERDAYYIKLTQLKEVWLNKVFELLVSYYM